MKIFLWGILIIAVAIELCNGQQSNSRGIIVSVKDTPYKQPVSVKYTLGPNARYVEFKKVIVDNDYSIYILTNKGVYRDFEGNLIGKDLLYASIENKIPLDITSQEETGYVYYLYPEQYLTNAHAGRYHHSLQVSKFEQIAVNRSDEVLVVGKGVSMVIKNGSYEKREITFPETVTPRLFTNNNQFYAVTPGNVYALEENKWKAVCKKKDITTIGFEGKNIVVGTNDGYFVIDLSGKTVQTQNAKLPVPAIRNLIQTPFNNLWFTTANGAYFFDKEMKQYRYFEGKRWLDNNNIISAAADRDGNIYLLSPTGLNQVKWEDMTLARKAEIIEKRLRKYHLRYGYSTVTPMKDPSDPTTVRYEDTDNDGLWGTYYLGSVAMKYAVTGCEEAKLHAWETFETFERCKELSQIKGFPPRTFERKGFEVSDRQDWRISTIDPDWSWKGHTSADEFSSYLLVTALMDECVAKTPEEKKRVAHFFDAIMTHIIDNNYSFVDIDGKHTLWGRFNDVYTNIFPPTHFHRRLIPACAIAGLQMAYKLTAKQRYKEEMFRILKEWNYWENMKIPMKNITYTPNLLYKGMEMGNEYYHSDDEMGFFVNWTLNKYALNDTLKTQYMWMAADHWEIERPEKYALWNLISYGTAGVIDLDATLWHLRTFGLDNRNYGVRNSHRKDIQVIPFDPITNFRNQKTNILLTPDEKPLYRHNSNAFYVDESSNNEFYSGDEYLFPYWMARYLKVIE